MSPQPLSSIQPSTTTSTTTADNILSPPLILALQLSSTQPTSTSTSTSTASTTTAVGNDNVLSPSRSPPLILAFLAIGLFSAAMMFVFGWRRIQLRRGWTFAVPVIDIHHHPDVEPPNIHLTEPKLWDLSNGGNFAWGQNEKGGAGDIKWVHLMPLSAKVVLDSPTTTALPLNNFLQQTRPNSNPLSRWNHRLSTSSSSSSSSRHDDEKNSSSADDATKVTMQLAVAIVLPSPQYPIYIKNRNIDQHHHEEENKCNKDRQKMTDYCIGMYECSWR